MALPLRPPHDAPAGKILPAIHFPNLNGVRFLAAAAVFVHHIEQIKSMFGLPSLWQQSALLFSLGRLGVVLFFVLSGFLITFLLLREEEAGEIRVLRFYARRALRIWPLYFVVVGLSLFVWPLIPALALPGFPIEAVQSQLGLKVVLYAFFLANVVMMCVGIVPYATQTWSIGAEEQFYLVWPVLMKRVRNKAALMIGVIATHVLAGVLLGAGIAGEPRWLSWIRAIHDTINIDCMAVGGLAAVILHRNPTWIGMVLNLRTFAATLIATSMLMITGTFVGVFDLDVYPLLFAILILNLAALPSLAKCLEHRVLDYLGRISYGLYMLHPLAIVVALRIVFNLGFASNASLYLLGALLTVAFSAFSFRFIEQPFLRLKSRYAEISPAKELKEEREGGSRFRMKF